MTGKLFKAVNHFVDITVFPADCLFAKPRMLYQAGVSVGHVSARSNNFSRTLASQASYIMNVYEEFNFQNILQL